MKLFEFFYNVFIVAGTYWLSRAIFENLFRWTINLKFKQLPWYLRGILMIFWLQKQYKSGELWRIKEAPTKEHFPWATQWKIIEPFLGFLLIFSGTLP